MSKYTFDEELKSYASMGIPVIKGLLPIMQRLMSVLYKLEKDDNEVSVKRIEIPTRDGQHLHTLVYAPKKLSKKSPCLVFIHGGGFVYQGAPHHFSLARRLTKELNCKTIFVNYRLAPKYQFPTAPQDCLDVYQWVLNNSDELNIDVDKIMVCGDSAGGNLATVLCLMARDNNLKIPCAQMLLYPVTDRSMKTKSMQEYTDTPMCNSKDCVEFYKHYAPSQNLEHIEYLSPIEAILHELPPAYVEVAEYDCLHDEGIAYASLLKEQGIEVELYETKNTMHGYDIAVESQIVENCMKQRIEFLNKYVKK